jgi:MFS family permease
MLPMMAGIIFTSVLSGRAMSRIGRYKWFPVCGSITLVAGMLLFTRLHVATSLWEASVYMVLIGIGLGLCMQSLILAVQNAVELRDLGAGTSAATFFRSLGGAFGVALLGAVLSNQLTTGLAQRVPDAVAQLPPAERAQVISSGTQNISINEPSRILALPDPLRLAIQESFVGSLDTVFLVTGLIAIIAVAITLALPNRELRGPGPEVVDPGRLRRESPDVAAVEMEARSQTLI